MIPKIRKQGFEQVKNEIKKAIKELETSDLKCKDFLIYVLNGIIKKM